MCECPGNAMASYLYVLWALEDELVKIGTSRKLNKRLSAHTGNSSNPLNFERWKLYQFATISDARKIEILVLERLAKRGLSYRGKRELFKCSPTVAAAVIGELCSEAEIPVLRNFPFDLNEMLEALAGLYVSSPRCVATAHFRPTQTVLERRTRCPSVS